jgi:hypothetical protein
VVDCFEKGRILKESAVLYAEGDSYEVLVNHSAGANVKMADL